MAVNRWSLHQLVAWTGTIAMVVLFIPMGSYFTYKVSTSEETSLNDRGETLGRTIAAQIVSSMLLGDDPALHASLHKAMAADKDILYLSVINTAGKVVAHTFDGGYPSALGELWNSDRGGIVRFRTEEWAATDIANPILAGQLGALHVGISRERVLGSAARMMWAMGLALLGALAIVLIGAHIIAVNVSLPLRKLGQYVSRFPREKIRGSHLRVSGTREIEALGKGFAEMVERLEILEHERDATQDRMVQAERLALLGEIAAGLAHEIHNPLDGMLASLRYLDSDPDKSRRATKYYPLLEEGLQRIELVMRKMLVFTGSGQQVNLEPLSVAALLDSDVQLVQKSLEGRRVRLTWEPVGDCVCLCDRHGLAQATLNLVLNAAEAAEQSDNPQVRISARCDPQWVYVDVEDNGPGVPDELKERIFDPFFTTKPLGQGTGLGLSVSRQLIRAAGGDIMLDSQSCSLGGSRFVIRLQKVSGSEECNA